MPGFGPSNSHVHVVNWCPNTNDLCGKVLSVLCNIICSSKKKKKKLNKEKKLKWSLYQYPFFCLFCKMRSPFNNCYPCPITDSGITGGLFDSLAVRIKVPGFFCWHAILWPCSKNSLDFLFRRGGTWTLHSSLQTPQKLSSLCRWWCSSCRVWLCTTACDTWSIHSSRCCWCFPKLFQISFCFLPIVQFLFVGR